RSSPPNWPRKSRDGPVAKGPLNRNSTRRYCCAVPATDSAWREIFERTYTPDASMVEERIWRDVFGKEYPEGLDPYSFVSRSELEQIALATKIGDGATLVDLGCGRGGAGLWVAGRTGATLVGIDIADAALAAARRRAAGLGLRATFLRGEFE